MTSETNKTSDSVVAKHTSAQQIASTMTGTLRDCIMDFMSPFAELVIDNSYAFILCLSLF